VIRQALGMCALIGMIVGCDPTAPLPTGAIQFEALPVYHKWWQLTQECSGLSGDFSKLTWFRVPGAASIPLGNGTDSVVGARWEDPPNRIVFAGQEYLHGDVVRHEMLHALTRSGGHDRTKFLSQCGGIVACSKACVEAMSAAPAGDPTAIEAKPTDLEVTVEVIPASPASSIDGGHFRMVITARNPASHAVTIELPPSGDAGPSLSFSYWIDCGLTSTFDTRAYAVEVTRFAAFENKRRIFDFYVGTDGDRYVKKPGTCVFKGAYGKSWANNPPTVVVSQ
jgi:hypothetical protein